MAAIDTLRLKSWADYRDLIIWLISYNPKMLFNIYDLNISRKEWDNKQKSLFKKNKENAEKNYLKFSKGIADNITLLNHIKETNQYNKQTETLNNILENFEYLKPNFDYIKKQYFFYKNADEFEYLNEEVFVADFRTNQDKYLLWHCPLDCIRNYLENQCGYKTRWYHKLFWKGKKLFR